MDWPQVCCCYDGSYAGFLTCVFECYARREDPVEIRSPEDPGCSLYPERTIVTDYSRAKRVYRSLHKLGPGGRRLAVRGFLTDLPHRELWLWQMIHTGLDHGAQAVLPLNDPAAFKLWKAVRRLDQEAHLLSGFTRFSELDGILVGQIAPKNQVLPLLQPHFCSRYPKERLVLHDKTHGQALFIQPGQWAILPVEDFQMSAPGQEELRYRTMWRSFYQTIAIQARHNERCRMSHMPKRYWDMMTEFQQEDTAAPRLPG